MMTCYQSFFSFLCQTNGRLCTRLGLRKHQETPNRHEEACRRVQKYDLWKEEEVVDVVLNICKFI